MQCGARTIPRRLQTRRLPPASKALDGAIGHTPGDVTLLGYRALVFLELGKYSDAAGVLNPVLASGPGWSWDTMVGFYDSSGTYSEQRRKLEDYAKGAPHMAEARFLLGYHYMVCGHMGKANEDFSKAVELQRPSPIRISHTLIGRIIKVP